MPPRSAGHPDFGLQPEIGSYNAIGLLYALPTGGGGTPCSTRTTFWAIGENQGGWVGQVQTSIFPCLTNMNATSFRCSTESPCA